MRKIFALVACLSVIATLAIGGSIAYLTDSDSDTNVMTMGNVDIEQIEDFENNKPLLPTQTVTKEVTVKNIGESPAYVRTFVAFENDPDEIVSFTKNDTTEGNSEDWTWRKLVGTINVPDDKTDVIYDVYEVVYNKTLDKGLTTAESLKTVSMAASATNAQVEKFNGEYTILVLSQAVQVTGFEDVTKTFDENRDTAFAAAFQGGEDLTVAMVEQWFKDAQVNEDPAAPSDRPEMGTDDFVQKSESQYFDGQDFNVYAEIKATLSQTMGDELFANGNSAIYFESVEITSTVNPLISLNDNTTIFMVDSNFTIPEGANLVDGAGGVVVYYSNLTINGEQIDSSNEMKFFGDYISVLGM